MSAKESVYLRLIAVRKRKGLLVRGATMYEVMTEPGVPVFVERKYLGATVDYDPRGDQRCMQAAQATAHHLFDEGRRGDWVYYPTAAVVPGKSLFAGHQAPISPTPPPKERTEI